MATLPLARTLPDHNPVKRAKFELVELAEFNEYGSDDEVDSPIATHVTELGSMQSSLLGYGTDPMSSVYGVPSVHTACVDGNLRLVEHMLTANRALLESRDILGSRPLHVAACFGHIPLLKYLIICGADINALDSFNSTPLVVVTQSAEAVELLVSFGADIDIKNSNGISARTISLNNPYVSLAISQGLKSLEQRRHSTLQYLVEALDPEFKTHQSEIVLSALTSLSTPTFAPTFPGMSPFHTAMHHMDIKPHTQLAGAGDSGQHSVRSLVEKSSMFGIAEKVVDFLYPVVAKTHENMSSLPFFALH